MNLPVVAMNLWGVNIGKRRGICPTMACVVPMRGFVRAQPHWVVDAGSRCMASHEPTVNYAAPELNIDGFV